MRYLSLSLFIGCLSLLLLGGCDRAGRGALRDAPLEDSTGARSAQAADLMLINARFVDTDGGQKPAQVVAVREGKILYAGPRAASADFQDGRTQVEDLHGYWLLPGFPAGHRQLRSFTEMVSLYAEKSLADYQRVLNEFMAANPDQQLIVGRGWSVDVFAGKLPHKDQLDQVSDRVPIVLFSRDGKTVWANSEALAAAEINAATASPPGGTIEKDPNGLPTGLLRDNAMEPLEKIIPPPAQQINFTAGSAANFVVLDGRLGRQELPRAQILQLYSNGRLVFDFAAP